MRLLYQSASLIHNLQLARTLLTYIALTQRLASIDSNLVEISGLKFFGKTEGDDNRRKAKSSLPKEYLNKAKDLKVGAFFQQHGSKVTFESSTIP